MQRVLVVLTVALCCRLPSCLAKSTSRHHFRMMSHNVLKSSIVNEDCQFKVYPELVVFDLDLCMWSPEMYTLSNVPQATDAIKGKLGDGEGVICVKSGYDQIRIFPAALQVLQDYYIGNFPSTMRIAAASSADTPLAVEIGRAAMNLLEVLPGITLRKVFAKGWPEGFEGNLQIGRSPPLSSNKAETHFPILKKETNIDYDKMIFFDDCNWGDHCSKVGALGVITQRTPRGLQQREWLQCLTSYNQRHAGDLE